MVQKSATNLVFCVNFRVDTGCEEQTMIDFLVACQMLDIPMSLSDK